MSSVKKSSATPSTKSARAKKKREEEERKKREEEEAQQRAEAAEKERAETEKRVAEEKKSVAKEINELRRRELTEFYEFIEPKREQAKRIHEKQREEFQWKRVMRCDGTPDPIVLPEINTFISLWREDMEHLDAKFTMQQTNLVLTLIREIQFVINSIPSGSAELARIPIYRKTIHELEDTLHHKWSQSIHFTMIQATDLQDLETNNFQYSTENENVTLCIWGNLSHNPRIQEFKFEKYAFGFKLPKPLTLANIAIVGFFLKYDYFSDRSALSKCRVRVPEYSYDPIPEALPEEPTKDANEGEDANKDQFDPSLPPELRKLMEQTKQREEEAAAAEAAAQREPSTVERSNTQVTSEAGQKEPGEEKTLVKDESGTQISADQILEELADESIIDLRSHLPLLPLLQIGLYNIPPQPKKVQDWTIMQLDDQDILVSYPYPSDPTIATRFYEEYSSLTRSKTGEIEVGKGKGDEKTIDPMDPSITLDGTMIENNPEIRRMFLAAAVKQESAISLTYKIPNDVYVKEKPLLARWIKERNHWRQEGYVNYQYTPETRTISFETYDFGIYALLNDRHAHMPFQSWRMRPKTTNHVYFTLNTQSFEITFEVRNDQVAVFLPARKPEIPGDEKTKAAAGTSPFANPLLSKPAAAPVQSTSALSTSRTGVDDTGDIYKTHPAFVAIIEPMANRFMTIKELIEKLRSVGLNVFPEADSESYVSVINKNHKLEWWVYNQMAIVASSAAFSYSHWNAFVNDELKIVLGCKEHLVDRSTADDDPRCLIFNNELVGFSDVCESSPEFVEASTFSDYHAELYHLVRDKFSAEAVARVMDTTPLFIETVHQLLMSIKPLTYA